MSKKNFRADIASGADRFFSVNDVVETQAEADMQDTKVIKSVKATEETRDTQGTKDTSDTQQYYRINLKLRAEYKDYLADEAWRQRISITELLNRMIGEYRGRQGE